MSYLGETTPKLGFGLMRLPQKDGHADIEQTSKMVDAFLDAGFTYFDTARAYGDSEDAIRQALVERYPRESYTLATKLAAWIGDNTEEQARAMFDTSLANTGAGYFDYYLLHNLGGPRTEVFERLHLWDFARELKESGKIRHLGISFHDTADVLEPILEAHADQIEFVQLQINWADWEDAFVQSRKCYETVRAHNLPVVIMEPVKGGMLANLPQNVADVFKASDPTATPASWALRFAANLPGIITVLSGMSTFEQMEQNLETFKHMEPLAPDDSRIYDRAREALASAGLIQCTACGYCQKNCPQEIPTPGIFSALNMLRAYGDAPSVRANYGFVTGPHKASTCIECGACEDACPQGLPIIDLLKEAATTFEEAPAGV